MLITKQLTKNKQKEKTESLGEMCIQTELLAVWIMGVNGGGGILGSSDHFKSHSNKCVKFSGKVTISLQNLFLGAASKSIIAPSILPNSYFSSTSV